MKQKQWLIPLLVLFIGIFLPVTGHAMELKDTDESVVKWDEVETETKTMYNGEILTNYMLPKITCTSYNDAIQVFARYGVDLVSDRKSEVFEAYLPFQIITKTELSEIDTQDITDLILNWMMFGNNVTKHEILSFSYSRSAGYENLRDFRYYVTSFKKIDNGYEGTVRITVEYSHDQTFFSQFESGVKAAVKEMDVEGKSDYDKAYALCEWIMRKVKYEVGKYDQSGMYAMVNKEAVCNGKAELACYMGHYIGLDTLYIGGNSDDNHAWILVKVDGEWYYADPTGGTGNQHFLQGSDYVKCDFRDAKYRDEEGPTEDEISPISYLNKHSSCNGDHEWIKDVNYFRDGKNQCTLPVANRYFCKKCRAYKYEYLSPPVGHDYVKTRVVKEATCEDPEISEYVCSRHNDDVSLNKCDGRGTYKIQKESAPALGHLWKESEDHKTATCEREGCGEVHYHVWKSTVTREATCTAEGEKELTCSTCGMTRTAAIKAKGHDFQLTSTSAATCTSAAIKHYKCSRCDAEKQEEDASHPALGHNWKTASDKNSKTCIRCKTVHTHTWDEGEDVVKATCTGAGQKKYTCTDCGDTKTVAVKSLGHDYKLVRTEDATCTSPAILHYECSRCKDTVDQEDKDHPALGHDWEQTEKGNVCKRCGLSHEHSWDEGTVTKEATCTEDGTKTYTCTLCGETKTETVPATGHKWKYKITGSNSSVCECANCGITKEHNFTIRSNDPKDIKDPTCTEAGQVIYICSDCGRRKWFREKETRPALGHDWKDNGDGTATCQREGCGKKHTHTWDEGEVTKDATCTEDGVKTYTCTYKGCSLTKTEPVAATGHQHTEVRDAKEATCKEEGYTGDIYCTDCGQKVSSGKTVTKKDHDWDEGVTVTEATCGHTGEKRYTCKTCGETKTEVIPKKDHTWDAGTVTKKADCNKEGTVTYTCTVCQATKTAPIPKTDHVYEVKEQKEATCTEDGYVLSVCKNCGDEKREEKAKTGHKWDNGKVTKEAGCEETGTKVYTCSVCGETKTETLPATGHQHTEVRGKKEASCTDKGYTGDTYCKDCGELLETGDETDALGHTWEKRSVVAPTYKANGKTTYLCKRCKETKAVITKKLAYPKAGTKYTVSGSQYKVTKAGAEVMLFTTNKNAKSVTIPATIKVKGITYKVTSIGTKAFNGNKKLTKVTIGANIVKISNNAFFKCPALKSVTVKTTKLTKKTADKKAFKGVNKKMVIKVPKKMKKVYAKIFKGFKVK